MAEAAATSQTRRSTRSETRRLNEEQEALVQHENGEDVHEREAVFEDAAAAAEQQQQQQYLQQEEEPHEAFVNDDDDHEDVRSYLTPPSTQTDTWTLRIRSQVAQQQQQQQQQRGRTKWKSSSIIVHILVTPNMTESKLGRCIVQASCAGSVLLSHDDAAGVFRERDGLFVPLEGILDSPELYKNDVWSLDPDSCNIFGDDYITYAQNRLARLFQRWMISLGVLVGSILFYTLVDDVQQWYHVSTLWLWELPLKLTKNLIDVPLREMYRYGPSTIGWEGQSLARICARITYHGDEAFWSRNLEECERIYHAKEEATLRIVRPLVYLVLMYMFYQVLKTLVLLHAERQRLRWQHTPDHDVEETYRAFQVLIRQAGRTLSPQYNQRGYQKRKK